MHRGGGTNTNVLVGIVCFLNGSSAVGQLATLLSSVLSSSSTLLSVQFDNNTNVESMFRKRTRKALAGPTVAVALTTRTDASFHPSDWSHFLSDSCTIRSKRPLTAHAADSAHVFCLFHQHPYCQSRPFSAPPRRGPSIALGDLDLFTTLVSDDLSR